MHLSNLFQTEKYLKQPMADGESDYLFPDERGAALGTERGDGDQRRLAFDRDLIADIKRLNNDINGHGARMFYDKDLDRYRLSFRGETIKKFSGYTWKKYSLSMKLNLLKNLRRIIIKRVVETRKKELEEKLQSNLEQEDAVQE